MPVSDLPQALTTHAVDGALIPWEIIPALKLQDSTKYQIEGENSWRLGTTTFQVSMNKARWESLPDDLKAVFDKASDEAWLKQVGETWRASDDAGIKIAVDSGNEHIVLTTTRPRSSATPWRRSSRSGLPPPPAGSSTARRWWIRRARHDREIQRVSFVHPRGGSGGAGRAREGGRLGASFAASSEPGRSPAASSFWRSS
jgi:hypothetical protein